MAPMFIYWDAASVSTRSLAFNNGTTQFLARVQGTAVSRQKLTISTFLKRATTTTGAMAIWQGAISVIPNNSLSFWLINNAVYWQYVSGGTVQWLGNTTETITDTTAFHNVTINLDTTQVATTSRIKIWIDETLASVSATADFFPALNASVNISGASATSYIGSNFGISSYYDGLLDQFYVIDNQALDFSFFSSGNRPIAFSGSYAGAIDTFLSFENNANTTTLGSDGSGEGNNWTLVGMSTSNSTTDVP